MKDMDREPFATVENLRVISRPWVVNVFGYRLRKDFSREAEAKALARKFEARVKEECRKAVEEFRNKASVVAWRTCAGKCGGVPVCEISEKILALPTEPEVEKCMFQKTQQILLANKDRENRNLLPRLYAKSESPWWRRVG